MQTPAAAQRKPWLDACRALAMILVIYGHIDQQTTAIASVIVPVKIPLFFAITGYLFNPENRDIPRFFRGLLFKLVIPWLFLASVQYIAGSLLLGGSLNPARMAWEIISGEILWYMPCCILAQIIFFMLNRSLHNYKWFCAACCACFCVGYGISRLDIGNTFALNVALIAQVYLLLGSLYRRHEAQFDRIKKPALIALGAAYLVLAAVNVLCMPGQHVDIHTNVYNILPLTLAMIAIGCFLVFSIFKRLPVPRWLSFIGQNTLCFYLLHGRFKTIFQMLYSALRIPQANIVLVSCVFAKM